MGWPAGCWRWPTFSGQSAWQARRLSADLRGDAHHHHQQQRHLIGTRRCTGPSYWPAAALEWRVGKPGRQARGERPPPDSANLSLLSGTGRPAHPTLHHGRTASLASEPGHGGRAKHLPEQPAHPRPHPPPPPPPCLLPPLLAASWQLWTVSYSERGEGWAGQ